MKKVNDQKRLHEEFLEFKRIDGVAVPRALTESILNKIHVELNPTGLSVFFKVTLIHAFTGLLTLLFCPQFGISLTSSMGLMHYLMQFGDSVCMLGCGALFMGMSFLVASLILRPEEVKALRKSRVLQITSLSTLSLVVFMLLGGDVGASLALTWILGAIVGGSSLLQLGWALRASGKESPR